MNLVLQPLKFSLVISSLINIIHNPVLAMPLTQIEEMQSLETSFPTPAVSEISNISSSDWNYQALQGLHSRYRCLANDRVLEQAPDVITRNYFAVFLDRCLNNLKQNNNLLNQEDVASIARLQRSFERSFIGLKTRINQVENRVNTLEKQSYFPQVKLEGEAIIAVADVWQNDNDSNLILGNRLRLDFITSFSEKDELQIRLQARDIPEFEEVTNTNMSNLGFDGADDNEVEIDEIEYEILLAENTVLKLYALGGGMGDLIPAINPSFSSSGNGAISLFGRENPIRRQAEGAAIAISQDFAEKFNFSAGYVSNNADDLEVGLFQSPYGAIAQVIFAPNEQLNFSLTYNHTSNNVGTGTGSELAENPFKDSKDITTNGLGGEFSWLLQPNITIGGRVGWIQASAKDLPNEPQADILTWAMMLGIKDLGREDSLLGLVFGQPPKAISNDLGKEFEDPDTAYHLELFYRWHLTDDITITPGFFTILNPEHNNENERILVGTIRTTFEF